MPAHSWPAGLPSKLRLGELFSGPGGMGWGATSTTVECGGESFGFAHAWANDIDESACRTYQHNIAHGDGRHVYNQSVRDLDLASLPDYDCLAFGFPCNDFSVVGEKLGFKGAYGPLYTYGVAALEERHPATFVAENVGGLASNNEGTALREILTSLAMAGPGYKVVPHLYNADQYGVPQSRRRILIVGIRSDLNRQFKVPAPTTKDCPRTAREAIELPPILQGALNNERTRQAKQVIERLENIPAGCNAFNSDLPDHLRLNVRGATISQIYRRLHPDRPSYTITGSGGGGTHVYHWEEHRALTNRERARLQSFPDDFDFKGSKEAVRKQIGMAVPPDLAKHVFRALVLTLLGESYDHVPSNVEMPSEEQLTLSLERGRRAYA